MCVNALHTVRTLAGQTRFVEVVNVGDVGVEDVEASNTRRTFFDSR
jgi:hypothetical protein